MASRMRRPGPLGPGGGAGRPLTRRAFLGTALLPLFGRRRLAFAQIEPRAASYAVHAALLYGLLRFDLTGTIDEAVDRAAGRYEVQVRGEGSGMSNRVESRGTLRDGRWAPTRTLSFFTVYGREFRSEVTFDHARRTIEYKSRSETFFLRRVRAAADLLRMPDATHVDDAVSATLNYADGRWLPEANGTLTTQVVRRQRSAREGTDDVEPAYHAELVPFVLRVTVEPATGKATALVDLTRFSSWARESEPARITFGADRRLESLTASLILGTSLTCRITGAA